MYSSLTGRSLQAEATTGHLAIPDYRRERGYESIRRQAVPVTPPSERLSHPEVMVEQGYDRVSAMREASRCLDCGVTPVFDGSRCVLCGGCVDVCPTQCLKLVSLSNISVTPALDQMIDRVLGADVDRDAHTAIVKDEERCIRCALCAMRCPADAITMERVTFRTSWRAS